MRADKIVQFVSFETPLDNDAFLVQWDQLNKSLNNDMDVTLQQTVKNSSFKYIAQHRYASNELEFAFTKLKKPSRVPEIPIRIKQAGGYSMLQTERKDDARDNESKVLVFVTDPTADLNAYKALAGSIKLNIYEAYYENCQYAYVLEYFAPKSQAASLLELLKQLNPDEAAQYKECILQAA
ncbi:hypothetical protein BH10BAC3_BH10BAC3_00080 [soil metagenome]